MAQLSSFMEVNGMSWSLEACLCGRQHQLCLCRELVFCSCFQNILWEPAEETVHVSFVCHTVCRARKMDNELVKIVYRLGDFPLHLATVLKEEKKFTLVTNEKKKDKECFLEIN